MIFENKSGLNTLKSFIEDGFRIERDGKIITMTYEEMRDFRYLDKAYDGRATLECAIGLREEYEFAKKYLYDEKVCYELDDKYYSSICDGDVEMEVAGEFIEELMEIEPMKENDELNHERSSLKSKIVAAETVNCTEKNEEKSADKEVDIDESTR